MHAISKRRSVKIEQKSLDDEAYFHAEQTACVLVVYAKNEARCGIDVSLESTTIGVSTESTTIGVQRGSRDPLEFSKAIERGLFAVVTVRPIEITVVKRMDLNCLFGPIIAVEASD